MTAEPAAAVPTAPPGAAGAREAATVTPAPPPPSPADEAARAIEAAIERLAQAVAALAAGSTEDVARAYEQTGECADHVARALWFLRRAEREHDGAAPGAG